MVDRMNSSWIVEMIKQSQVPAKATVGSSLKILKNQGQNLWRSMHIDASN